MIYNLYMYVDLLRFDSVTGAVRKCLLSLAGFKKHYLTLEKLQKLLEAKVLLEHKSNKII